METCAKKVLILEDDIVNAWYMQDVLESSEFKVTSIANTAGEALEMFAENQPDLLVCCIYLKNGEVAVNFVEQAKEIKKVPVIYVSSHDDEETLNRALDSSPESYITKPFTDKQLLVAARLAVGKYEDRKEKTTRQKPTKRELQIIRQLAKGLSTKEIADKLFISYETVKSHRKNIYKKFGVSSGLETIAMAFERHWLSAI